MGRRSRGKRHSHKPIKQQSNGNEAGHEGQEHDDGAPVDVAKLRLDWQNSRSKSRGSLFRMCDTHTQTAIIELREALEALRSTPERPVPDLAKAELHIKESMEVLLASGEHGPEHPDEAINAMSSKFHDGLRAVSRELSDEVAQWLSATYSPRIRGSHSRRGSDQPEALCRQPSDIGMVEMPHVPSPAVAKELDRAMDWDNFDVFALHEHSRGHCLGVLAPRLFEHFDLYSSLKLNKRKVQAFWNQVEAGYRDVPYHNCVHAADVLQVMAWLMDAPVLKNSLEPLEICAGLVAAGIHDHDHPGLNNNFMVQSRNELALLYNDKSVLENHHASTGLRVLMQESNNFLSHLDRATVSTFRQLVINMVLATDMSKHFQLQADYTTALSSVGLDSTAHRSLVLEQMLHCADISNCGKPFHFAERWGVMVVTEFCLQGDKELELGLPVSPMGARTPNATEQCQIAFIQTIVIPMLDSMVLQLPELDVALEHSKANVGHWTRRMKKEGAGAEEDKKDGNKQQGGANNDGCNTSREDVGGGEGGNKAEQGKGEKKKGSDGGSGGDKGKDKDKGQGQGDGGQAGDDKEENGVRVDKGNRKSGKGKGKGKGG